MVKHYSEGWVKCFVKCVFSFLLAVGLYCSSHAAKFSKKNLKITCSKPFPQPDAQPYVIVYLNILNRSIHR